MSKKIHSSEINIKLINKILNKNFKPNENFFSTIDSLDLLRLISGITEMNLTFNLKKMNSQSSINDFIKTIKKQKK